MTITAQSKLVVRANSQSVSYGNSVAPWPGEAAAATGNTIFSGVDISEWDVFW